MSKETETWRSERLEREVGVVRWGETGTPVLVFPTAAGDAEEIERFLMIDALSDLLAAGRIKVYSVDSVGGQALFEKDGGGARHAARTQNRFDSFVYHEVVPAIRADCRSDSIEVITAGASIGAFNALASLCRHPDVFSKAICLSGTYDLRKFMDGDPGPDDHYNSPLRFLPTLGDGEHLAQLRRRFVLLAHGQGRWEEPGQSWRAADALGAKGIPNRVDAWGKEWDHDWPTWRAMLPKYVDELVGR